MDDDVISVGEGSDSDSDSSTDVELVDRDTVRRPRFDYASFDIHFARVMKRLTEIESIALKMKT